MCHMSISIARRNLISFQGSTWLRVLKAKGGIYIEHTHIEKEKRETQGSSSRVLEATIFFFPFQI